MRASKPPFSLFWVKTRDHHEDCFVVSDSTRHAREFFELSEGYNPRDAKAELLEQVPPHLCSAEGYASHQLLRKLGYRVVNKERPVIFSKKGRTFVCGSINYTILMDGLYGRSGVYYIRCAGSDYFKIGHTTNIHLRVRKLQTGCPFRLIVDFFIPHSDMRRIEDELQGMLSEFRTQFEWYQLPPAAQDAFFERAKTLAVQDWKTQFHRYQILVYESRTDLIGA